MIDFDSLIRDGFFPKELPPTFHTSGFADFIRQNGGFKFQEGESFQSRVRLFTAWAAQGMFAEI